MNIGRTFIAAAVLLTGCDSDGESDGRWRGTIDTLANGTVVVSNPAAGLGSEPRVLREDLRIGAMHGTGPDVFASVTALAVDQGGRIFVLDGRADELRVFGPDGNHLRTLGGSGQGPGELANAIGLAVDPTGAVWVIDAGNARYSVFDSTGALVDTHHRPIGWFRIPWPVGFDREGRLIDVGVLQDGDLLNPAEILVRVDVVNGSLDTIPLPHSRMERIMVRRGNGALVMALADPFSSRLHWRFDARGFVWSTVTDRYELVQQDMSGDTVRIVRRQFAAVPVTSADRDLALERVRQHLESAGAGASLSRDPQIPDTKPPITGFVVDGSGGLWVEVAQAPGERQRFDVFDAAGRYLGPVIPEHEIVSDPLPVFSDDAIVAVVRDSLDVPYVVRLRIDSGALR